MTALADHGTPSLASTDTTFPGPGASTRAARPSRRDVWALLALRMDAWDDGSGARAAWQGPSTAVEAWRESSGPADLDIWCTEAGYRDLDALLTDLGAARVQHADDPARLRHTSYAVETRDGLAVVDLTRGDLRVGPVLMVPQADVRTTDGADTLAGLRLTGAAAVADLFVRPLLRGRIVDDARLEEARSAWRATPGPAQGELITRLAAQLGALVAGEVSRTMSGARPTRAQVRRARRALAIASLRPRHVASTWRQRHTVLPSPRRNGVLGIPARGCLVVLVGTDGSGKSTVAGEIERRLDACGIPTASVYMGMARGNLPGVATARRLLGISAAGDGAPAAVPAAEHDLDRSDRTADHALLRRAAAWFYAVEYGYRWWRDIRPALRDRRVVISDRYVYDLRESPWPGSTASRVAERLMPRPDVLVLPDAPDAIIHARKPERSAAEQAAQQERFRVLLDSQPARRSSLRVDTSGNGAADGVAPVIQSVIAAMHRDHTGSAGR